jgi:hypothetical protein
MTYDPDTEEIILSIGKNFWMTNSRRIEVNKDAMKYQYPFDGRILIFRPKGTEHPIFKTTRVFELDQII